MIKVQMKRFLAVVATTLALVVGSSVVDGSPAVAAGGGCITWDRGGWSIQACSSNQARSAYLDFYVNRTSCAICGLTIYKQIGGSYPTRIDYEAPTLGHHGPWEHYLSGSESVRLVVVPDGTDLWLTSPFVWY
jgi:hypothetical protein